MANRSNGPCHDMPTQRRLLMEGRRQQSFWSLDPLPLGWLHWEFGFPFQSECLIIRISDIVYVCFHSLIQSMDLLVHKQVINDKYIYIYIHFSKNQQNWKICESTLLLNHVWITSSPSRSCVIQHHSKAGISLEASVLPALGAASLWQRGRSSAQMWRMQVLMCVDVYSWYVPVQYVDGFFLFYWMIYWGYTVDVEWTH